MSKKHTYVLGLNCYDHDVSACLLRDGEIAYAIAKERITREKHDAGYYKKAVDYCLDAEGITLADVDLVVRNCYVLPVEELETRVLHLQMPNYLEDDERVLSREDPLFRRNAGNVLTVSHHLAHAYSAFAACPFEEGVVMVVDGVGSYRSDIIEACPPGDEALPLARESESYYKFSGARLETLKKVWMGPTRGFLSDEFVAMPGLGALYSRGSSYIFADWNKCGELMGLAPYGRPDVIKPVLELKDGVLDVPEWGEDFDRPWLIADGKDWESDPSVQHWMDVAWRVQADTEKVLLARAIWLRETTGARNLCIAGGVALNCVANGRLAREAGYDNVWIQPAAGDDGIAIGCAYYGHLAIQKNPRKFVINHAYLGVAYDEKAVDEATERTSVRIETNRARSADICRDTARVLAEGKVVGWFQGRSEFGPRALGNRSILADPRDAEMKDILNKRVKHRQAFRPFAPCVLFERAREIFEGEQESPFMLLAMSVRPEWRDKIPAIVHVDGTARVQTIRRDQNERLYRLIQEFDAITGVPVILNTSFNVKGEPIVETPSDAVACFLATGIDCLAIHDRLITKSAMHRVVSPLMRMYQDVRTLVSESFRADLSSSR